MVNCAYKPGIQICRRISELVCRNDEMADSFLRTEKKVQEPYSFLPRGVYFGTAEPDNVVLFRRKPAILHSFIGEEVYLKRLDCCKSFYNDPVPSVDLDIYRCRGFRKNFYCANTSDIQAKCYKLPYEEEYVCFPMPHSFSK